MMNKLFKPASLLMYLLIILVFFMAGMTIAGVTGVAEGQGPAGGAIVFMYGVFTSIISFIISLFVAYKAKINTIKKINKIFGILLLVAGSLFAYRIITLNKSKNPVKEHPTKVSDEAATTDMSVMHYIDLKKLKTAIYSNL
jgi:prolipoprotein diacylglyceryltransferase